VLAWTSDSDNDVDDVADDYDNDVDVDEDDNTDASVDSDAICTKMSCFLTLEMNKLKIWCGQQLQDREEALQEDPR
jgi:hypothetical protein